MAANAKDRERAEDLFSGCTGVDGLCAEDFVRAFVAVRAEERAACAAECRERQGYWQGLASRQAVNDALSDPIQSARDCMNCAAGCAELAGMFEPARETGT